MRRETEASTHTHTHIPTHTNTYVRKNPEANTHTQTYTYTCKYTNTGIYICTHTHTCKHTHANTHTPIRTYKYTQFTQREVTDERSSSFSVNTLALTKPDKARMVESMLIQMAQRGQIQGKVTYSYIL